MVGVVGVETPVPQQRGALWIQKTPTVLNLCLTVLGTVVVSGAVSHLQYQVQHHRVQCPVRRDVVGVVLPVPQQKDVTLKTLFVVRVPRVALATVAACGARI